MDVDWDDLARRITEQGPRQSAPGVTNPDLRSVLDLEAHHLDDEGPVSAALLAQLVLSRARSLGMTALADSARARIVAGGHVALVEQWRTQPFSSALRRTLVAERGGISDAAFTPEGRLLSTCDGVLREWDVTTGASRRVDLAADDVEPGRPLRANTIAVSTDGRRVALTFNDDRLRVLHPHSGRLVTVGRTRGWIERARFLHHDPRRVVTAGHDRKVHLWDVDAGEVVRVFCGHDGWVSDVAVSDDDTTLVSASYDGTVRVWDVDSGVCRQIVRSEEHGEVFAVAFVDGDSALITASTNGVLHHHAVRAGLLTDRQAVRDGRSGYFGPGRTWSVTACGSSRLLLTHDDGVVDLRDTSTSDIVRVGSLTGHADHVRIGTVDAEGRSAVTGADDGRLLVWNLPELGGADGPLGLYFGVDRIAASTAATLTVCCPHQELRLVARDLDTAEERWRVVDDEADGLDALWFSTTGAVLYTTEGGTVKARSTLTGAVEATTSVGGHVTAGRGDVVVTVKEVYRDVQGYRVAIADARTGARTASIVLPAAHGYPGRAAVARDLTTVVLEGDGRLTVWRSAEGAVDTIPLVDASASTEDRRRAEFVGDVAVDDDGCHALALGDGGLAYLCDLSTHTVTEVRADGERAPAAAGTSGHRAAIVGSHDGAVSIWDLATAETVCRAPLDSELTVIAADGGTLAVGDAAGNTHVLAVLDGRRPPAASGPFPTNRRPPQRPAAPPQRPLLDRLFRRK